MIISNVICPYQGTAKELEEEFEEKPNYLFLSNAVKVLWKSSPLGEKWFWIYIAKGQAIMYVAKIDGFKEWPKDKIKEDYKNAEKFNSVKEWKWENQHIKYSYRVSNLYKLHDSISRELLEKKYNIKGKIRTLVYSKVYWEQLTEDVKINQQAKIF